MSGVFRINGYNSVRRINTKKPASGAATGWWLSGGIPAANCIAAYQPKGAADLASSYINLANPGTYNITETVSSPGWNTTDGWINDNNNDKRLDTGITVGASWSFALRVSNISNGIKYYMDGFYSATFYHYFQPDLSFSIPRWVYYHGNKTLTVSENATSGVFIGADRNVYHNAVLKGTLAADGSSGTPPSYYLLGRNYSSGAFHGYMQAVAIYDIDISSYVSALTTAMNAL